MKTSTSQARCSEPRQGLDHGRSSTKSLRRSTDPPSRAASAAASISLQRVTNAASSSAMSAYSRSSSRRKSSSRSAKKLSSRSTSLSGDCALRCSRRAPETIDRRVRRATPVRPCACKAAVQEGAALAVSDEIVAAAPQLDPIGLGPMHGRRSVQGTSGSCRCENRRDHVRRVRHGGAAQGFGRGGESLRARRISPYCAAPAIRGDAAETHRLRVGAPRPCPAGRARAYGRPERGQAYASARMRSIAWRAASRCGGFRVLAHEPACLRRPRRRRCSQGRR